MKRPSLLPLLALACLATACSGGGGDGGGEGGGGPVVVPLPSGPDPSAEPYVPTQGSINPLNGVLFVEEPLPQSWEFINGTPVQLPRGTVGYDSTLTVGGLSRRYLVIRPAAALAGAPAMLLLHPRDSNPELMANLSDVAEFVATQGFWAVLPQALGPLWQAEPGSGDDDIEFIGALLDALVAEGVDASRISVAGYSSGGVMAQRLGCEMAERIAAVGSVAATLPLSLWTDCAPAVERPKVYVLGTDDPITPYFGLSGRGSAESLMNFWVGRQDCRTILSQSLPDLADDGMTVQADTWGGCRNNAELRLYTVYGGEHAWPGGQTDVVGRTTRDLDATGIIWKFFSAYRR